MSLTLARVAAVHPEDNSVDLVMVADGAHLSGVQVLSMSASTDSGIAGIAEPSATADGDKWSLNEGTDRDLIAAVAYIGRRPVVTGFLFPQVCQMLFKRKNFFINRHPSDVYTTIDDNGNVTVMHPNGTFLQIGTSANPEDLTFKDFDKKFVTTRNKDKAVFVKLRVVKDDVEAANFTINPNGTVSLQAATGITMSTPGFMSLYASGDFQIQSDTAIRLFGPSVTHNGKNIGVSHTHGGVTTGAGTTGAPT